MPQPRFTRAREVFEAFPPVAEMIATPPTDEAPARFARALAAGPTPEDAVAFCAHALPRREAVWWACVCVRALLGIRPGEEDDALRAAEAWGSDPGEAQRRAALARGEGDRRLATAWLALAAAWSGGSLAPPGEPPRPALPHMTARAATIAILTALARVTARERAARLGACVEAALGLLDPARS
ncbi:DUF6931 family protein [Methylobacterium nodulans]|uniref:Uncharacterized protein n=1 Tax=Methylobacterium nodulans (strain LMG 21967 / CNCM I-2342 / ORS 2060) TaxID=460265 RepID=B8IIB6_METNO|nr:hypothetical protein [Methylobacterium nodulans]ACL57985.1 conserved hypothetical protein [Methylobacterium nodulans ORS 2060]